MSESTRFRVQPARPYSLQRTAARFLRFPEVVDHFEADTYRRLLQLGSRLVLVSVKQEGPPSRALLEVRLQGRGARSAAVRAGATRLLERGLGIGAALPAFYRAHRGDPVLGPAIRRARGLSVAGSPDLWEALVTAVLSQQVNLSLAYGIRRELALRFGRRARFAGRTYIAFPRPERIARETLPGLHGLRLSRAKAGTLLRLAEAFRSGALAEAELEALDDEPLIERLTAIKGIGRWTAEVGAMRGLARPDIFPAGDLGVVKYLAQDLLGHDGKASEPEMRAFSEAWRPHRSLALTYAWAELAHQRQTA